jgi:uncharacterized membrane protein YbhN (UPF0104 family)
MPDTFPYHPPRVKKLIKLILPWLLCVAIFAYIFSKTPPRELWASLQHASLALLASYTVLYFFFAHTLDCLTIKHFISRFATPIAHKESWIVRGVSYLFMIFNYYAAQGAFAIYFKKTHKAPIAKTLGTLAFINSMDLMLIVTYAAIAVWFAPASSFQNQLKTTVMTVSLVVYTVYFLFVLFWKKAESPFIVKHKKWRFIRWLLDHDIFMVFREAKLRDFMTLVVYRLVFTFIAISVFNLSLFVFNARIAWNDLYLYLPFIFLIGSLPITPAGLGTSQFLVIELFQNRVYGDLITNQIMTPQSLLLTASLVWIVANQILKVVFGSVCLQVSSKKLFTDVPLTPDP